MSRIISIGTAVPAHGIDQGSILELMQAAYGNDQAARKLGFLFRHSGICRRHTVMPDFSSIRLSGVEARMEVYRREAPLLGLEAVKDACAALNIPAQELGITHVITVSCTGVASPGLDSELQERLGLPGDISRIPVNFVGCNAAFTALRIADAITRSEESARVLVVCVELCTLHFQAKDDNDSLLSNTLFADGAAAAVVTSDTYAEQNLRGGLAATGFCSLLLGDGKCLMGWNVSPLGFEMTLDAGVADFIGAHAREIMSRAEKALGFRAESIDRWAVHPGGKKILDRVENQLKLEHGELLSSYKVLESYGNMSSPTILFVLKEIMKKHPRPEEAIFSLGFGPGLSVETALFRYAS